MSEYAVTTHKLQEKEPKQKKRRPLGCQGKQAARKHKLALTEKYVKTSAEKRQRDIDVRCPEGDSDQDGGVCTSSPFLFTGTTGTRRMENMQLLSEDVLDFYLKHGPFNQLVEVRSGVNIANKLGDNEEKGVFSLCPIAAGTHICPYVGEIYHKQPREGKFVMEVSEDVFVDAEHDPRDIDYLYFLDAGISS